MIGSSSAGEKQIIISAYGNSMFPTISDGDMLTIDTSPVDYDIDDIVVFYSKEKGGLKFIAHRIIHNCNHKMFITKGDNNYFADPPIRLNKIIGKVVKSERRRDKDEKKTIKKIILYDKTHLGG